MNQWNVVVADVCSVRLCLYYPELCAGRKKHIYSLPKVSKRLFSCQASTPTSSSNQNNLRTLL